MSPANKTIQPQAAPLSHLGDVPGSPSRNSAKGIDRRNILMGVVVLVVVAGAITTVLNSMSGNERSVTQQPTSEVVTGSTNNTPATNASDAPAPFAATQIQRNRDKAQSALAEFVEKQIELEENMDVAAWGQEELRAALAIAEQGDNHFLAERFSESLAAYSQATQAINEIIVLGDQVHQDHVDSAQQAFDNRDPALATQHIEAALSIKPDADAALLLQQRIAQLPQIITLIRDAKNHELGGRPEQALAIYDQILTIDPAFQGLAPLRQAAYQTQADNRVADALSRGFAALDRADFDAARRAFNQALKIEPGNDIALGGLAQVAKDNDLAIIKRQRQTAEAALATEDWAAAEAAYQAVLDLDANIQFARAGRNVAQSHAKSWDLLNKIKGAPDRLSNERLFLEASDIVKRATTLSHAGPKLSQVTQEVADLLELYRDPVDVVLISDNATDIIVSNVGRLGTFDRKSLKLRPGEYTIRGSQNGCRDIYLTIKVLPGIEPLDLSCPERL